MVYLPPPQYETPRRLGYERTYLDILATHRKSTRSSSSSLIILVAPDVDALCAARMLADLLKQDDILYRIMPVSGMNGLEEVRDELSLNNEVRSIVHRTRRGASIHSRNTVAHISHDKYGLYSGPSIR